MVVGLELEWVSGFPIEQSFHQTIFLPFFFTWVSLIEPLPSVLLSSRCSSLTSTATLGERCSWCLLLIRGVMGLGEFK